jgi:hypothetical protein
VRAHPSVLPFTAAVLLAAGCSGPEAVVVDPAPTASDPVCAEVLLLAPVELGGLARRPTTSQATRAWGDPPIVLRCGVVPPGPSPERCVRVTSPDGDVVDWLAIEGSQAWTFVTYGRTPAVEVLVPLGVLPPGAQATAPLVDLSPAIGVTTVERTCL